MKTSRWRRLGALLATAGLAGSLLATVAAPGIALAADVTINVATTFAVADASDGTVDGVFNVTGNLTLGPLGSITCNDDLPLVANADACPIKIVVTGNLVMQAGSAITAENLRSGGSGGAITITVGGNMTMCGQPGLQTGCIAPAGKPGALISSRKFSSASGGIGGFITITVGNVATATGAFYMEGGVKTYGAETGAKILASGSGPAGDISVTAGKTYFAEPGSVVEAGGPFVGQTATAQGGKIFLVSDCGLTSQGRVTSKGPDYGADLVHLSSCDVLIEGLVESTGKGHVAGAANSCDLVVDGLPGEVLRDHPAASTGCVEVWGNLVKIDSSTINPATNVLWAGELNADIGNGGGEGTSWIDIFAKSKLTVTDGTGNDRSSNNNGHTYFSTYAVHANAINGSDHNPGVVTALVASGPLTASGKAFEASSTLNAATGHGAPTFVGNGSFGGTIDLEASGNVTLDTAWVNASGNITGTVTSGGHIVVSSWNGGLSWQNGYGDVRNNTDGPNPPGLITGGDIKLNAAVGAPVTTGTNFNGEVPSVTNVTDASKPVIPTITAPNGGPVFSPLWANCGEKSSISGMKFNDLDADGIKDLGEPGLNGWTIHLFNATGTVHLTQVTANGGKYSFTGLDDGTYTICEQVLVAIPPWLQTFPTAGPGIVACNPAVPADPAADNPTPGPLGYTVTVTSACTDAGCGCGQQVTDKDFGNVQLAIKSGVKWLDADGDHTRDLPQDVGLDGWVIHLFGTAVNGTPVHQTYTTAGGPADPGHYTFTVLPGTYTVCEQLQVPANPPWTQTFPTSGANCITAVDPAADNPTPGPLGYAIVLTGGEIEAANDFGNTQITVTPPVCNKGPVQTVLDPAGQYPGNTGPDYTVRVDLGFKVQDAVDAAALADSPTTGDTNGDGYIIILVLAHPNGQYGGSSTESVLISQTYAKPFALIGCSVTLNDATPHDTSGTIKIESGASSTPIAIGEGATPTSNIFLMDLHGSGSDVAGVEVWGDGRYLRNEENVDNAGDGFSINGNSNTVRNSSAGDSNHPNGGDGFEVNGNGNRLGDDDAFNNGGDGFKVTGDNNKLLKLDAGDRNKGNDGSGIHITGKNNTLSENSANANELYGFFVEGASSTGNSFEKNESNAGNPGGDKENGLEEYKFDAVIIDLGGNKKDNASFTTTAVGAYE